MRDFVASRVVDGRQQIRASISFHEFGRVVMWPYAATHGGHPGRHDGPGPRRPARRSRVAWRLASRYTARQASDLYLASGTTADYLYGRYRVFAFTVELSAVDYPKDTAIGPETSRNREAVLWLLERAWCPLGVLGAAVRDARCGAFDDDMEVARGWTVDPDGTDTAPASGRFVQGQPGRDLVGRDRAPAGRRGVRPDGAGDGGSRRVPGERVRPRRADHGAVRSDHAAGRHGPAAHVPLAVRPPGRVVVVR